MATYTRDELIDAFCELTKFKGVNSDGKPMAKAAYIAGRESKINAKITERKEKMRERINDLPTAKQIMARRAYRYLNKKNSGSVTI